MILESSSSQKGLLYNIFFSSFLMLVHYLDQHWPYENIIFSMKIQH